MPIREDTLRSLTWLEYYGLMRLWGKSPVEAIAFCETPPENMEDALAGAARAFSQAQGADTERLWTLARQGAALIPMVGGLLSQGLQLITQFATWLGGQLQTGLDQECSTARPESYNRRNFIGLSPAPLGSHNMYVMPFAMHDGLVFSGPGRPDSPDAFGPKVGVCGVPDQGGAEQWFRAWARLHPYYAPKSLAQGDPASPWNQIGNNWYWRSEKVASVLTWAEHKLPCRLLASMYFILKAFYNAPNSAFPTFYSRQGTSNGLRAVEDSALDEMRRKGGRWYASLYMMQRDFWALAHSRGIERTDQVLTQVGAPAAIAAFRDNWLATGLDGDTGLADDYSAWAPQRSINAWTRAMGALSWQPLMDGLVQLAGAPTTTPVRQVASIASVARRLQPLTPEQAAAAQRQRSQSSAAATGINPLALLALGGGGLLLLLGLKKK